MSSRPDSNRNARKARQHLEALERYCRSAQKRAKGRDADRFGQAAAMIRHANDTLSTVGFENRPDPSAEQYAAAVEYPARELDEFEHRPFTVRDAQRAFDLRGV